MSLQIIAPVLITDSRLVSSNVPENDLPLYNPAATYDLNDSVMFLGADTHNLYKSQMVGNIGNLPTNDIQGDVNNPPTHWLLVGKTNRWRMLDRSISTQTRYTDELVYVFKNLGPFDSVFMNNLEGQFVNIRIIDDFAGVVFDQEFALVSDRGVTDWYGFYYTPYQAYNEFYLRDLPKYIDALVEITISNPGGMAACGECVLGLGRELGDLQFGVKTGINDFSRKTKDDFGNWQITEKPYTDYANVSLYVPSDSAFEVKRFLTELRAKPIVFIGNKDRRTTWIYGFYTDFSETIQYATESVFTMEMESLT